MPEWIKNPAEFDIHDVLKDSLYYPACGHDGHPVEYFMGNVHSFVYVDYSISRENLLEEIANKGFRGYRVIHQLPISESQLAPNGWRIRVTPDRAEYHHPDHYSDVFEKPFAEWFIFERTEEYGEDHNPSRFSLLFICADGAAAYQALYLENRIAPKILAIIQPGEAFGCNWTDFTRRWADNGPVCLLRDQPSARICHKRRHRPQRILQSTHLAGILRVCQEIQHRCKVLQDLEEIGTGGQRLFLRGLERILVSIYLELCEAV